jgi:ABC-type polysaccharide/polyol phosphate transport system ATPase subunit
MSILGLSKHEIDQRFQDVLDFADIGDAIDTPVQSYSSGMAARLGFASAIHTEPDILLIDEVLAVGDAKLKPSAIVSCMNYVIREYPSLWLATVLTQFQLFVNLHVIF